MSEERPKILVVEDDDDIREIMALQLEAQDYEVALAKNGFEANELVKKKELFDLYILDWMLPGPSGIELCQVIRQSQVGVKHIPILMVTAKAGADYIVDGLDAGADDYITKPFAMEIFLARVRALLRRNFPIITPGGNEDILTRGPLAINEKKFEVLLQGQELQLTISEFKILKELMLMPGHVFTRRQLIEKIAGLGIHVGGRTIDTQLVGLRKKLGDHASLIETIRGIGYRFKEKI